MHKHTCSDSALPWPYRTHSSLFTTTFDVHRSNTNPNPQECQGGSSTRDWSTRTLRAEGAPGCTIHQEDTAALAAPGPVLCTGLLTYQGYPPPRHSLCPTLGVRTSLDVCIQWGWSRLQEGPCSHPHMNLKWRQQEEWIWKVRDDS